MQKKIIYWVQGYRPLDEAISKEIRLLHKKFNSLIFNIVSGWKFSKALISFNFRRMPFGLFLIPFLERRSSISHIYTGLGNYFYLRVLRKKPIILTGAGPATRTKVQKCLHLYKKLSKIIVESERDREMLLSLGIPSKKVTLIYPGVDLNKFKSKKATGKFKVLFASAPLQKEQFNSKGLLQLLEVARTLKDVEFLLLWRGRYIKEILQLTEGIPNIRILNKRIKNINKIYSHVHATIMPSTTYLNVKPCPQSIVESIASGKPVLVSNVCGIADLIKKEKCGLAFEPNVNGIIKAMKILTKKYDQYQKRCDKVAAKYFDKDIFLMNYDAVYTEVTKKNG